MIHYHGVVPQEKYGAILLRGKHALVPFMTKKLLGYVARVCQSFCLDNSAFAYWKSGKAVEDWTPYYAWVREWMYHPGFDWAAIPDVIDGTEDENRKLVTEWLEEFKYGPSAYSVGCPVWHMHESTSYLRHLAESFRFVAIGSSGKFKTPGTRSWHMRMNEAMKAICDKDESGKLRPICKVHGMRMLDKDVFTKYPLASADSVNVALRVSRSTVSRRHMPPTYRAQKCLERIEPYNSAGEFNSVRSSVNHLFGRKDHESGPKRSEDISGLRQRAR